LTNDARPTANAADGARGLAANTRIDL